MVVSAELLGVVFIGGRSYVFDRLLLLHGFEVGGAASHTAHAWHTGEGHFAVWSNVWLFGVAGKRCESVS